MINSGQTCTALTRMLIPRSRYAEALELARAESESLKVGDPLDPQSYLGPMCSASQRRTVLDYIRVGQQEGARLLSGGAALPSGLERGFYVRPTLFADVDNSMRIAQEEIFGPVLCLVPYEDEEQAVRLANESPSACPVRSGPALRPGPWNWRADCAPASASSTARPSTTALRSVATSNRATVANGARKAWLSSSKPKRSSAEKRRDCRENDLFALNAKRTDFYY